MKKHLAKLHRIALKVSKRNLAIFLGNSLGRVEDIAVFTTVVEAGGFSAAARRLGMDPSTVSKTILRLEERLDVRLLDRNSRNLAPTEDGEIFYEGCRKSIDALADTEARVRGRSKSLGGKLRIFLSSTIAENVIGPSMSRFNQVYPDIEFDFHLRNGYVDPVEAGVDLTLSHEPPKRSSFVMRRIGQTQLVTCATPAFLERNGTPVKPEDLAYFDCVLSTRSVFNSWHFKDGGKRIRVDVSGRFRASQGSMLRLLTLQGLGIGSLALKQVITDLEQGRLTSVLDGYRASEGIPLWAVYHDRRHLNPRIRHFVDFLASL